VIYVESINMPLSAQFVFTCLTLLLS